MTPRAVDRDHNRDHDRDRNRDQHLKASEFARASDLLRNAQRPRSNGAASRTLKTPREVRNAIVYVLMNRQKHASKALGRIDPCSSALLFDGWKVPPPRKSVEGSPVAPSTTWLLRTGWKRHGLIDPHERPKQSL
jgi:hypothetical protein